MSKPLVLMCNHGELIKPGETHLRALVHIYNVTVIDDVIKVLMREEPQDKGENIQLIAYIDDTLPNGVSNLRSFEDWAGLR